MHKNKKVEDKGKTKGNNGYIRMLSVANARKPLSKWPKQKEFIGLHKRSLSLAGPKDTDDVKITFPPTLSP